MIRRRQQGAALLLLLAVLTLGGLWYIVAGLNNRSADFTAVNRSKNARVLSQAKQTLLGYVAHQAAISGENNPGAFLCPEAAGNIGTANEGVAAGNCGLPAVGRLPWKTLGIDKLVDVNGEPLWYVVANGWAKPTAVANTIINSNCTDAASAMTCYTGQLTMQTINADGSISTQPNAAIALIIAPGPPMNVPAVAGCTARNQAVGRAAPAPSINPLNYVECYNIATSTFTAIAPRATSNDQVVSITAAEALPLIEAAVADRFQKEFAPLMRAAYAGGPWSAPSTFPFAVPIADPTSGPTNRLQGAAGTTGGLLPGSYAYVGAGTTTCSPTPCVLAAPTACTVSASDPRCAPAFVAWRNTANNGCATPPCTTITQTTGASIHSSSYCSVSGTPSVLNCTLNSYVVPTCNAATLACLLALVSQLLGPPIPVTFNLDAVAANAGMTWKYLNAPPMAPAITGIDTTYKNSPIGYDISSATLNTDGSATLRLDARVNVTSGSPLGLLTGITCNLTVLGVPFQLCYQNSISVPMALLTDQPMLDPSNTTYNWFYRNRWPEVAYYSVATTITPGGTGTCTTGTNCLQVDYSRDAGKHRSVLIIGGPKVATQTRPATSASDLLDGANADGASPFEIRSPTLAINRAFNDHFAVIDKNP